MILLPAWFVALMYGIAAVSLIVTMRAAPSWLRPGRWFLVAAMIAWMCFYLAITLRFNIQIETYASLARWLHAPTAVAIVVMVYGRWLADRKIAH